MASRRFDSGRDPTEWIGELGADEQVLGSTQGVAKRRPVPEEKGGSAPPQEHPQGGR